MIKFIYGFLLLFISSFCHAQSPNTMRYKLYLDADFMSTKSASISISQGINSALAEVNFTVSGYQFEVQNKNHQGNSLRSKNHLEQFLADPQALLVFSGLHSPPILANKAFINNNHILLLDPWAAAGPITRSRTSNNWIFRLSIDDSKAGYTISQHALKQGFNKPFLLLEDTGWGKSNKKTMTNALQQANITPRGITWFNWGLGKNQARLILRDITASGADVIFFVGNAPEGKMFAKAMSELPSEFRLPIRSHWGITGGDFAEEITPTIRKKLDIEFIQTSFSFLNPALTPFQQKVLENAIDTFPELNDAYDIQAQSGFIHGYDLTKLLIAAIKQSGLTGDAVDDRQAIKRALENLKKPVQGLIKTYQQPFSNYNIDTPDAHEALDSSDYTMGFYGPKNEVILLK
ncbi:ABC transporter substrate-binding protein [Psychromonas hadalis]|uniref:ABC transporter substrate-binding protein n=1 Tax=Psychromonas hadalis TaxID=211669 RepID=UPI0003B6C46A|nr:ABC transporter substrate-binding protein [Psychromonas hadalis]